MHSMGKSDIGVSPGFSGVMTALAPFLVLAIASIATASPPSRQEHYVHWEKVKQLSMQFFAKDAQQFIELAELDLDPALPGARRQHLKSGLAFFNKMVELVIPSLKSQKAPKVKAYFKEISDGRWIEGKRSSPKFSGDTFARIQLVSTSDQEYKVIFEDWSSSKQNKAKVFGISFSTGIRSLPIYDKDDVFAFNSVNNFQIRNSTWGDRRGPENPASFIIKKDLSIREIGTMHWPYIKGKSSGSIRLKKDDGSFLGPWETEVWPHFGGYNSFAWVCHPNIVLKQGTYEIVDSDLDSWMNNDQSERRGMSWVIASPPK